MALLSVDRVELGYCGECGAATVVARLQLRPWRHALAICASCLRACVLAIDRVAVQVVEGTHG